MSERVTDNLPRVFAESPKYNVNRELASFNGVLATEAMSDRIRMSRERFLEELDGFLAMCDIHNVKTRTQWEAVMKICEKLMSFDYMINQCFTGTGYEQHMQFLDKKAEDLIKELGEN